MTSMTFPREVASLAREARAQERVQTRPSLDDPVVSLEGDGTTDFLVPANADELHDPCGVIANIEVRKTGQAIIDANPALAAQSLGDFPNVPAARQHLLETVSQLPPPNLAGIKKSEVQIPVRDGSSIRALIYKPAAPRSYDSPLAVLFHGGGWCIGVPELEELNAAKLVRNHGAVVLSIDYRKAPEKPFPTAVTDSWDALVWVSTLLTWD
ncbi:hypothetical protein IL306_007732 [Fusarium sp. DS 682]|nr:hypothetical protein IL306_007732 [Fusarium sp. DS 682]